MIELTGQPGELRFTLEITRAATGETETVELIGTIAKELIDGGDALDSSPQRRD
jgi:hypothetical protein